jgi:mono/diheme cytochrome c family protein
MHKVKLFSFILVTFGILLLLLTHNSFGRKLYKAADNLNTQKAYSSSDSLNEGRQIYDTFCADCHGVNGNGQGQYADLMKIKPTDFRSGKYEFKSTPFGTLPTVNDIVSTLELGVRTTAMIPQWQLNTGQMREVAEYILSFAPKGQVVGKPIFIPPAPQALNSIIDKGRNLFDTYCSGCHGKDAKGDGPSADKLVNYKGKPIRPANLTVEPLKRANTPDWMYKVISNGIEGTPMPAFFGTVSPDNIWAIADYINSLPKEKLSNRNIGGMMGGMMMGGMMDRNLVGEENIGARIDMAAAHAWMMRRRMNR